MRGTTDLSLGLDRQITARKIRYARKLRNMSQETLAELTGIRRCHISEMENAKRGLGRVYVRKLCEAFNLPYEYFLNQYK